MEPGVPKKFYGRFGEDKIPSCPFNVFRYMKGSEVQ